MLTKENLVKIVGSKVNGENYYNYYTFGVFHTRIGGLSLGSK